MFPCPQPAQSRGRGLVRVSGSWRSSCRGRWEPGEPRLACDQEYRLPGQPACFPLKLSMESACSCETFQFCKISVFQGRNVPLENFQPALTTRTSLTSHTEVELKVIKFPSKRPWAKCSPCLHPELQSWSPREPSVTAAWWFCNECHHVTTYSYSICYSLTEMAKWQAPWFWWPNIRP